MYNDLLEEGTRANTEITGRESTCTSTIASIAEQLERVRTTQADLNRQAPLKAEELADKLEQIDERMVEMKRNNGRLQNFQANREEEHRAFEARRDDLTTMVVGLKEAKDVIA
jgi:flagellar capping protein FliD